MLASPMLNDAYLETTIRTGNRIDPRFQLEIRFEQFQPDRMEQGCQNGHHKRFAQACTQARSASQAIGSKGSGAMVFFARLEVAFRIEAIRLVVQRGQKVRHSRGDKDDLALWDGVPFKLERFGDRARQGTSNRVQTQGFHAGSIQPAHIPECSKIELAGCEYLVNLGKHFGLEVRMPQQ